MADNLKGIRAQQKEFEKFYYAAMVSLTFEHANDEHVEMKFFIVFEWYWCNPFNPFSHTINLQQKTLNIFCQRIEDLYNCMDNLWLKVENIVAKGEIARFEKFLLLLLCFQNAVCCRGVRKRLYDEKGEHVEMKFFILFGRYWLPI